MNKYYLGIDTSAYTTSIGVVDRDFNIILNLKKVLKVKKDTRGLRQQEAVFQHINNIPALMDIVKDNINIKDIISVGYTDKPRNIEGSYMPVFNVSKSYGSFLSSVLGLKSFCFSHQEGHIEAGLYNNHIEDKKFIVVHISGGTTEILLTERNQERYITSIIGGTKDISAGKLIDRVGVSMGLGFPSGEILDLISAKGNLISQIPISFTNNWINFSGPETFFLRSISEKTYKYEDIAKSVLKCIERSLEGVLTNILKEHEDINKIIIVGGVASNNYLRENLELKKNSNSKIYFSSPNLSTDNGVGIALLTKKAMEVNRWN